MKKLGNLLFGTSLVLVVGLLGERIFNWAVGDDKTSGFTELSVVNPESVVDGVSIAEPVVVLITNRTGGSLLYRWRLVSFRVVQIGEVRVAPGAVERVEVAAVGNRFLNKWVNFEVEGLDQQLRWWIGERL